AARPGGRHGARALGAVQRLGRDARGSSGSHAASAGRVPPEPLWPGLRLQRRPRVRADRADAVPGAGRQRRGAPAADLRGGREALAEVRVHPRMEAGRGAGGGDAPGEGVPREAHAAMSAQVQTTFRGDTSQLERRISMREKLTPAYFERERDKIFRRAWLPIGHASHLPEPGSYFIREMPVLKTSLLVV